MNLTNNNYDAKTNRFNNDYTENLTTKSNSPATDSLTATKTSTQNPSSILQKGNEFQGTITDIRQNEVSIQLKDGSNISAKIANPSNLQIGETADFKVVYQSEKSIGIEIISNSNASSVEPTVIKALEGANLPINDKNQLIVTELLNNNMSIDKQSLLNILRDSYKHPDVTVNTLVLMNKYNIPLTDQNIVQFDQYKNMEHRIMNGVTAISNELPNLIEDILSNGTKEDLLSFHRDLSNLLMNNTNVTSPVTSNINESTIANGIITDKIEGLALTSNTLSMDNLKELLFASSNIYMNNSTTTNILSIEERNVLLDMIPSQLITPEEKASLMNGDLKLSTVLTLIQASNQQENEPLNQTQNNLLIKLVDSFQLSQKEQGYLSAFLSSEDRTSLSNELLKLPLSDGMRQSVLTGSITSSQFIQTIQSFLLSDSADYSQVLLKSKSYQKVLQEMLESKWSLTPKSLSEAGSVENLYKTLQSDLDQMSRIFEQTNLSKETISHNVSNLKDNLDFMKTINEMFTYIQLPVKLRNQNLHSDLYIYTNKKELKDKRETISVLLHLDMDHLGPTDIHLTLHNSNVIAKFYISDEDSKKLIEDNLDLLQRALTNKCYTITSEVNLREKEVNLVDDLLEHNSQTSSFKRYSFDIRT